MNKTIFLFDSFNFNERLLNSVTDSKICDELNNTGLGFSYG